MEGSSQPLRHIVINDKGSPEKFTRPNSRGPEFQFKPRDRQQHGESLKEQLQETARQAEEQAQTVPSYQVIEKGFYIEFESDPGYELKVDSLKDGRQDIRLVAVSERINADGSKVMKATVFAPEGKVSAFIKKVEEYLDPAKDSAKTSKPRNQPLVESIARIRLATLKSFWTDSDPFPEENQELWWEIWLRTDQEDEEERRGVIQKVRHQAASDNLQVKNSELVFPDTTVLLIRGTAERLTHSLFLLNVIAEIRRAKETADSS